MTVQDYSRFREKKVRCQALPWNLQITVRNIENHSNKQRSRSQLYLQLQFSPLVSLVRSGQFSVPAMPASENMPYLFDPKFLVDT